MAIRRLNGQVGLVLDKTAFYPAGGGQPADTGVIKGSNGEVKIIEVHIEKETVLHIANQIAGKIDEGDIVNGFIDWGRRYS
jgi:Ser-tRNA(Ala) deacylase AlaX